MIAMVLAAAPAATAIDYRPSLSWTYGTSGFWYEPTGPFATTRPAVDYVITQYSQRTPTLLQLERADLRPLETVFPAVPAPYPDGSNRVIHAYMLPDRTDTDKPATYTLTAPLRRNSPIIRFGSTVRGDCPLDAPCPELVAYQRANTHVDVVLDLDGATAPASYADVTLSYPALLRPAVGYTEPANIVANTFTTPVRSHEVDLIDKPSIEANVNYGYFDVWNGYARKGTDYTLTASVADPAYAVDAVAGDDTAGWVVRIKARAHDVTFDPGIGTLPAGQGGERIVHGQRVSAVPEPQQELGHVFVGWSLDGTTPVDPATVPITADTTFRALYRLAPDVPPVTQTTTVSTTATTTVSTTVTGTVTVTEQAPTTPTTPVEGASGGCETIPLTLTDVRRKGRTVLVEGLFLDPAAASQAVTLRVQQRVARTTAPDARGHFDASFALTEAEYRAFQRDPNSVRVTATARTSAGRRTLALKLARVLENRGLRADRARRITTISGFVSPRHKHYGARSVRLATKRSCDGSGRWVKTTPRRVTVKDGLIRVAVPTPTGPQAADGTVATFYRLEIKVRKRLRNGRLARTAAMTYSLPRRIVVRAPDKGR